MNPKDLDTYCQKSWCPGCPDFLILEALKKAVLTLVEKGTAKENIVFTTGIGCHGKTFDYLNLNSFYCLHGRSLPVSQGIKLANPALKVLAIVGDGDIYNEGMSHLIHAAKRNSDITVLVYDNRNFALTVSQFTATSPKGFKGSSSPEGSIEEPLNPLELVLAAGGTFIARGYALKIDQIKDLIVQAIEHKGFSFLEILQPCITFFDNRQFYQERIYELKDHDFLSKEKALTKIREWDYKNGEGINPAPLSEKLLIGEGLISQRNSQKKWCGVKIPLGVFYKIEKPSYNELVLKGLNPSKRENRIDIEKILKII